MTTTPAIAPHRRLAAWVVHMVTASGAFFGFLALLAVHHGDLPLAFRWLLVTFVIDTVDGSLARWVGVSEVTPRFEGFVVDCIVDYLTYVIAPVAILYQADLLPPGWGLVGAALILMSSTYHYGNLDVKAPDFFFWGFPAWWNLVVFYLYVLQPGPWVSLAVVLFFVVFTPIRLKYIHPFRVAELRWLNALASVVLAVSGGVILWQLPQRDPRWIAASLLAVAYLGGLGIVRTLVPRGDEAEVSVSAMPGPDEMAEGGA